MIELKNVSKIYKSKKGIDTKALDQLNLKIGNKGMVFITGTSGSGKSTLLNLLGGLDGLTSGEIIINGKNIEKFTNKQYDAYRNTYIGFIFQEFNVLEQYNVYENIELSLKLQQKKSSKEEMDHLLKQLGIENLGERKINELSGGQKQRVAIARALIKEPEIILADEPTGNLDKNSSIQIFDILKEISKEKLVIVVSHDREAALRYADRMIELEDGKIIHDQGEEGITPFKEIELKKSKLPLLYALKMSLTSFKVKPFKLLMTIILTACSLIFMGLTVNLSLFDQNMFVTNTMKDNQDYRYSLHKTKYEADRSSMSLPILEEDIKKLEEITDSTLNQVYSLHGNGNSLMFEFGEFDDDVSCWHAPYDLTFMEVEDDRVIGKVIGRYPREINEIVIHKYLAEYMMKAGVMTKTGLYFPKTIEEMVTSKRIIQLGSNDVYIVGVVDDDNSLYEESLKRGYFSNQDLESYFSENYRLKGNMIYVKGFVDHAKLRVNQQAFLDKVALSRKVADYEKFASDNIKDLTTSVSVITDKGIQSIHTLSKDEVIISEKTIRLFDQNYEKGLTEYLDQHRFGIYENLVTEYAISYLKKNQDLMVTFSNYSDRKMERKALKVKGISLDQNNYISHQYVEEYKPILKEIYSVEVYDNDTKHLRGVFKELLFFSFDEEYLRGTYYRYSVSHSNDLAGVIGTYKALSIYILVVSLVFVLFTFLLFSNFISISISYQKKEIGILRALGATNKDIVKIFGYEAIIIGLLSWILSMVGWFGVCRLLNQSMFGNMYFTLNGIVTHPLVPFIMLIYTFMIAILITMASVKRITKIKPIDAILNK